MAGAENNGTPVEDQAVIKVVKTLTPLLTEGEKIEGVAIQTTIASVVKKDAVVLTNRRVIVYRPKLMGRMDFVDLLWQDITDVHVDTQILGATFYVSGKRKKPDGSYGAISAQVSGLNKTEALGLYGRAQTFEQEWREKTRIREMEEERAKAGGVYMQTPGGGASSSSDGGAVEERLERLQRLHTKGLIADAEYESQKARILSEL